jgi:hypothetical protein
MVLPELLRPFHRDFVQSRSFGYFQVLSVLFTHNLLLLDSTGYSRADHTVRQMTQSSPGHQVKWPAKFEEKYQTNIINVKVIPQFFNYGWNITDKTSAKYGLAHKKPQLRSATVWREGT